MKFEVCSVLFEVEEKFFIVFYRFRIGSSVSIGCAEGDRPFSDVGKTEFIICIVPLVLKFEVNEISLEFRGNKIETIFGFVITNITGLSCRIANLYKVGAVIER